jgi:hypothetical protein
VGPGLDEDVEKGEEEAEEHPGVDNLNTCLRGNSFCKDTMS